MSWPLLSTRIDLKKPTNMYKHPTELTGSTNFCFQMKNIFRDKTGSVLALQAGLPFL